MKFNYLLFIFVIFTGFFYFLNKNKKIQNFINSNIKNIFIFNYFFYFINKISNEFFIILFFLFIFRFFLYEPFRIPSASMIPTLLKDDFILVEKFSYNIRNPITNKIIFYTKKPKYGDLVVFQYPYNKNNLYIKRIIGLPNDIIFYDEKNKIIKIYKKCNNKKKYCLKKNLINYSNKKKSLLIEEIIIENNSIKELILNKNNINIKKIHKKNIYQLIELFEKKEKINKKEHNIILIPNEKFGKYFNYIYKNINKIWFIPKNNYFVLGDYRDNSLDSRYWGFLNKNMLIGKAKYIWMSLEKENNNFFLKIRLKRIGKIF